MKCSALDCPNDSRKTIQGISYHGFPKNIELCNEWLQSVGKPGFVPKPHSKICSVHFKKSDYLTPLKLKSNAVPSLLPVLRIVGPVDQQSAKGSVGDPMACILGSDTGINDVVLVHEINITTGSALSAAGVSSTKLLAKTCAVQNTKQNAIAPITLVGVPSQNTGQSQSERVSNPPKDTYKCPIKVVDMKKLLMKQILEKPLEEASNSESQRTDFESYVTKRPGQFQEGKQQKGNFSFKENTTTLGRKKETTENKNTKEKKCSNKGNGPLDTSEITVFHILECLRVILPNKFDLARLVPNEKVASLIIRYYKLNDDEIGRHSVVTTLRLVINSTRLKEKVFKDSHGIHPYLTISDEAIQTVLRYTLPKNFCLTDVSKEVLKCMCLLLKQEIFSDGYQILLNKIRNYSTEPKMSITDFPREKVNNQPFLNQKTTKIVFRGSREQFPSDKIQNIKSESSLTSVEIVDKSQYPSIKTQIENDGSSDNDYRNNLIEDEDEEDFNDDPHDMDWTSETELTDDDDDHKNNEWTPVIKQKTASKSKSSANKIINLKPIDHDDDHKDNEWTPVIKQKTALKSKSPANKIINLKNIMQYLELKKCLAKDVLGSFGHMFYLCRHLQIMTRKPNVRKIENLLKILMERKVQRSSELEDDAKLNLKPIVIMHNLADYSKEKMLFMRSEENCHNFNGYFNNSFRDGLGQMKSVKTYTDDQVNKRTEGCYKHFRRIIMKRNDTAVVFRLKYTRLNPGCVVFVKHFRSSSGEWLRGTVNKRLGALNYSVKLETGEIRHYLPEQLRPIIHLQNNALGVNGVTNLTSRRSRPIKMKQLLDL